MLTVADVARITGIPKRTVLYAALHGELKATRIGPSQGMYLIDDADLEAWLEGYLPVYQKREAQPE